MNIVKIACFAILKASSSDILSYLTLFGEKKLTAIHYSKPTTKSKVTLTQADVSCCVSGV